MMGLFPVKWTPTFASLTLCCNIEGDFELRVLFRYFGTLDFCHTAGENVCFAGSEVDLFAVEPFILFFFFGCVKSARMDILWPLHGVRTLLVAVIQTNIINL